MANRRATLDAGPLLAAVRRREIDVPHNSGEMRALNRARETGRISWIAADNFAVRVLGVHPATLWPDEWFTLALRAAS